jgi:hypothetical protein
MAMAGLSVSLLAAADKPADKSKDAGGLGMNYTKVSVGNLPIGNTISMTQLANAPLIITSNYDVPVFANISVTPPMKDFPGYEPLPDLSWVTVDAVGVTLPAHGNLKVDVKVSLPNDEKLLGKKYRVGIKVFTPGNTNIKGFRYSYTVNGSFLFSVAPGRNDKALAAALKNPVDADYEIFPPRLDLWEVKAGATVDVINDKQQRPVLKNHSKNKQKYFLASVDAAHTDAAIDDGAQFSGKPDDLALPDDELTLSAGENKELKYTVKVPAGIDFSRGPLVYLVSVKSGKLKGIERFITVYLWGGSKLLRTGTK